jgi:hypothetical protein
METKYEYTLAAWAEAFTLLAKNDNGMFQVDAEHDIIYVTSEGVTPVDKKRLKQLGWKWSKDLERFYKDI